ncbi:MAG: glutathione S-transferase family protein [Motiliproteus sp.]
MTNQAKPKLWHCYNARSLRPLWTLEEMGVDYDLEVMLFPPRFRHDGFKDLNNLGTVPYFVDGADADQVTMTESSGICLYLVERYQQHQLGLKPDHPEYGDYLNWLFQSDATLTFPQTIFLRYTYLEKPDNRLPQVASDYAKWFISRLSRLDNHIKDRQFLCDNRMTIADITVGYALLLGELLGLSDRYSPQVQAYLARLKARPALIRAQAIAPETDVFKELSAAN